ncbi:Dipeptidyl peptidase 2 [Eumeta japonica]|uniref:Dipeptidyl peptidase 2 n=1 Tax=Eumeta variegata TaxID=151549 RepID=A0A4C1YQI4_EUMVA|nr:Dipeptidyl peptidase 2 [Eumeta japonica]
MPAQLVRYFFQHKSLLMVCGKTMMANLTKVKIDGFDLKRQLTLLQNTDLNNGLLDPWTGGGILSNINDDVKAIIIKKSAHHLDLMASNPNDPRSVVVARDIHKNNIRNWITNFAQATIGTPHRNALH